MEEQQSSPHEKRTVLERDLLVLLALWNTDVTRSQWAKGAAAAGLMVRGRAPSATDLLPICERLVAEEAVEEDEISAARFRYRAPSALAIEYLRDGMSRGVLDSLEQVASQIPYPRNNPHYLAGREDLAWFATMLRIALLKENEENAKTILERRRGFRGSRGQGEDFAVWLSNAFGPAPPKSWLQVLTPKDAAALADHHFDMQLDYLVHPPRQLLAAMPDSVTQLARHDALRGGGDEALAQLPAKQGAPLRMLSALCRGEFELATDFGEEAIKSLGKRKYKLLRGADGVVHMLVCLGAASTSASAWDHLRLAAKTARTAKIGHLEVYDAIDLVTRRMGGDGGRVLDQDLRHLSEYRRELFSQAPWHVVLVFTIAHGLFEQPSPLFLALAEAWRDRAMSGGFNGVAREFDGAIALLRGDTVSTDTVAGRLRTKEPWELGLDSLALIAREEKPIAAAAKAPFAGYIRWTVFLSVDGQRAEFLPRVVSSARSTKGKEVSLRRLLDGAVTGVSAADRAVLAHAKRESSFGRAQSLELPTDALVAFIDHPHVARASGEPLQVVRGEARLFVENDVEADVESDVESDGDTLRITIVPERLLRADFAFEEESSGRVVVYTRNADLERIAGAFGRKPLVVPASEATRLSQILAGLSSRVSISAPRMSRWPATRSRRTQGP